MPSAIAGMVSRDGPVEDRSLDGLVLPGLAVTARAPGLRALGTARIDAAGRRVVHGTADVASAEMTATGVTLRRDAVGVRPLYYAPGDGRMAFATHLAQLLHLPWAGRAVDWEGVLDTVAGTITDPSRTCLAGIRQVPPGCRLAWSSGTIGVVREWDAATFLWDGNAGPPDPAGEFAERLTAATARRSTPDSTVLLSGGLDSPAVAAAAVRAGVRPRTLTSVFPSYAEVDETEQVLAVRKALGLEGELVAVDDRGIDGLPWELEVHGEPHPSPNHGHLWALLSEARRLGCSQLLDGHDGDGVLGPAGGLGTQLWRRPLLLLAAARHYRAGGYPISAVARSWAAEAAPWARGAVRVMRRGRTPEASPLAWAGDDIVARMVLRPAGRDPWRNAQMEAVGPRLARTLGQQDRMAAAFGLTIDHPFADRELIEFLLSLPPEAKFAGGRWKALVRDGFPELPLSVRLQVRKVRFDAPTQAANPLDRMAAELLDPPVPVPGVQYSLLRSRLASGRPYAAGEMGLMRRLALAHRFLAQRCVTPATG